MRQTELSLSKRDRQIVHEFRSKGLHIGRTLLHCSQGEAGVRSPVQTVRADFRHTAYR